MIGSTRSTTRRVCAWIAVFVYLAVLGGFLLQSVVGDTALFPLSYFFKWDMFPSHNTRGLRRVAIGRTVAGKYLQLHPSPFEQHRGGVHGDLTRVDLDARGLYYRTTVEQALKKSGAATFADPVAHVYLFEKSWPAKFNYPADLYEAWFGSPRPDRVSSRLVDEFEISVSGAHSRATPGEGK
jgi:hypothetical protein